MKLLTALRRSYLRDIYEEVSDSAVFRSTVLFTVICGFFVHFFMLSNYIFNHDSVILPYTNMDWLLTQGKWFVTPLHAYKGTLALNYIGGAVGIVATALLAGVLTLIFSVRSKWAGWLIGAVAVAFPSVATMLMYRAADYFQLVALMAVLAAYFAQKDDWLSILLGIVLLTFSIGSYQAYLGLTASILVLLCILDLLRAEHSCQDIVLRGLRYIVQLLVSIGLYYAVLQVALKLTGTSLDSYKGINDMASILEPTKLCEAVLVALNNIYGFLLQDNLGQPSRIMAVLYTAVALAAAALAVWTLVKRDLPEKLLRSVLLGILLVVVYPLAINIIGVLSANQSYYYITVYPFIMLFICVPVLLQECFPPEESFGRQSVIRCVSLLLVAACVWSWFIRDNQGYQKLFHENYNLQSKSTALVAQIQDIPGYTIETPVVLMGSTPYLFLSSQGMGHDFDAINTTAMGFGSAADEVYAQRVLYYYIVNNISPFMTFGNEEDLPDDIRAVASTMPVYPNQSSIQMVDGYILVKLGVTE
ncbi:glucosyltransferase domain-containing protein [Oscillibacter valericigenes]|uniref:glucosyltransferase domain-containing protein n=1 Tax=Oscillibacter valericigenes TaxID=351091 RepID=UPI001F2C9C95|nr:glucosyltransferase domain-containing protein [Oscillibacter valericigenes]MCF2617863.1 glucosyltransferase domain-containing protein [Oscillibacter valericigenes]